MKRGGVVLAIVVACMAMVPSGAAQRTATAGLAPLVAPVKTGGLPVMEALARRASVREWAATPLTAQDVSDLLWAANGVNRPDGRRTAASAMNAQDVDVYVLDAGGVSVYDAAAHALRRVADGDHRAEILGAPPGAALPGPSGPPAAGARGGPMPAGAPVQLMLVSDLSRFRSGSPELRVEWAALDTGLVAQNVSIFCASRGLATVPRASFNRGAVVRVLQLKDSQRAFLNMPVGYPTGR